MLRIFRFFITSSPEDSRTKLLLILAIFMSLLGGAVNIALLTIVSRLLAGNLHFAWPVAVTLVALGALLGIARGLAQYLLTRITMDTLVGVRLAFCSSITSSPLATLERLGAARLTAAFTESMPSISNALVQLPGVLLSAIVVTGGVAYMAWLSWKAALVLVLAGIVFFISYRNVSRAAQEEFGTAFKHYRSVLKGFRELLDGAKELKLHRPRRKAHLAAAIGTPLDALARHRMKSSLLYGAAEAWFTFGTFFTIAVILAMTRNEQKGVGTGFMLCLIYLTPFVQAITAALPSFSQAESSINSLKEITDELSRDSDVSADESDTFSAFRQLTFEAIEHRYSYHDGESSFHIGPVNLSLSRGEVVFITGGNGSGKTTLMKVLAGLYQPECGTIRINGVTVEPTGFDAYRQQFSSVFFDFHLFDQIYGLEDVDTEAESWLKELKLDHKVKVGSGKISTIDLSQGQKKRLALLTAYLENRPIYLFDEWAADQDLEFREFFYHQIIPGLRRRNKTVLVVTHDDRYFHLADRLIRMEMGRVVSQAAYLLPDERLSIGANWS